jgi:hypothetical protein
MSEVSDAPLYNWMVQAGMSFEELWMSYLAIAGELPELELEAYLLGLLQPDAFTYNVIAHTINERFLADGHDHPIEYRDLEQQDGRGGFGPRAH